jgi:heat shock protein HtpX
MNAGPWAVSGQKVPNPWSIGGSNTPFEKGRDVQKQASSSPWEDEALGLARERQNYYAKRAKSFDFRSAIRSNQLKTMMISVILAFLAASVGATSTLFVTKTPQLGVMGITGLALLVLSLGYSWLTLRTADYRILKSQGGMEVHGTETGEIGMLARRLHNVTAEMALASGMPMPKVYLLPEEGLNAFAVGRNPNVAAVAATEGLVRALTRDELQAVMAHEMAHIAQSDTRVMVTASATAGLVLLLVDLMGSVMRTSDSRRLGAAAFVGFIVAWIVAAIVIPLLNMALSRQREYMADANAVKFTRNPAAMASALRAISDNPYVSSANHAVAGMYIMNPCAPSKLDFLLSTHPPIEDRIARLMQNAKKAPEKAQKP